MTDLQLGSRIAQAREAAHLTQEELGKTLGVGKSVVSRIEAGQRPITATELEALAQRLHLPIEAFVLDEFYEHAYRAQDLNADRSAEAQWFRSFRIRYRAFVTEA